MKEGLRLAELGEIPFDEKEILRYAMLPSFVPAPEELPMKESLEAAKGAVQCRAVWCRYPLKRDGEELDLGFARTTSQGLAEAPGGLRGDPAVCLHGRRRDGQKNCPG